MIKPIRMLLLLILANSSAHTASLEDLDFMTGRWQRSSLDGVVEEWWMAAEGNTKVAAFRWAKGDEIIAIELVIISSEDDGIFLRFKHFGADYEPWEKDEPNSYLLTSSENDKAVFVNTAPRPGIPNIMIYRKINNDLEFRGKADSDSVPGNSDFVLLYHRVNE